MKRSLALLLLVGLTLPASAKDAVYIAKIATWPQMDVVRMLGPVLLRGGNVGRVYYRAACTPGIRFDVPFPRLRVQRQPKDASGVAAVRAIFRNEPNVVVTGEDRIIRIVIGDVPDDLLNVRISRLALTPEQQYNVIDATLAIFDTDEVKAAERRLGIRWPLTDISHLMTPAMEDLPHLPSVQTNLTVDQALDAIAKTFNRIVFYGINSCASDGAYYVNTAMIDPEQWTPRSYPILKQLQIPSPYSFEEKCEAQGEDYDCEVQLFDSETDAPTRLIKFRAVWTDNGWSYSLRQ
jgi:hypothetical protein